MMSVNSGWAGAGCCCDGACCDPSCDGNGICCVWNWGAVDPADVDVYGGAAADAYVAGLVVFDLTA
jgi:hypothetical protein